MSAKKQKSYPNESVEEAFQPFEGKSQAPESTSVEQDFASHPEAFSGQTFWFSDSTTHQICEDALLRPEIERRIDERVARIVEERLQAIREQAQREGFERGVEEGRVTTSQEVEQALGRVTEISRTLIGEKARLLHSHEKQWLRSFGHLLRRFLIPTPGRVADAVASWLQEGVRAMDDKGRVRVYLSAPEYERLQKTLTKLSGDRWEFLVDGSLKEGGIRCECDEGGFIFSPRGELERLEALVQRLGDGLETG